jgi:hypothetical protein
MHYVPRSAAYAKLCFFVWFATQQNRLKHNVVTPVANFTNIICAKKVQTLIVSTREIFVLKSRA